MILRPSSYLLTLSTVCLLLLLVPGADFSVVSGKLLRRQTDETEQEGATPKNPTSTTQASAAQQVPPRLYPDLPQRPNFVPPFDSHQAHYPPHHGPTPFVPFANQIPPNRLNAAHQHQQPPPKPMTPAERLQSQSFANGLGRRLLSMVGIEPNPSTNDTTNPTSDRSAGAQLATDDTLRGLQNSTILHQLNKGINSIYGGLSKMYNSTVQQQLNLLQERFKMESQNSTNPWHRRMAQQVPQFFKQMAAKVEQAQEQLNRVWQDVSQANNGSHLNSGTSKTRSHFGNTFDQFMATDANDGFFGQIGRSIGFDSPDLAIQPMAGPTLLVGGAPAPQSAANDFGSQLKEFWHTQVQPQIGMVRNQMARVWRDLANSGSLSSKISTRARSTNSNTSATTGLLDDILNEVDMNSPEYTLIEPKGADDQQQSQRPTNQLGRSEVSKVSSQMQNDLIAVQRELNMLWMGLTNSLQGIISNLKRNINWPSPQFTTLDAIASSQNEPADPAENELNTKIQDLSRVQKDTDMVYDVLRQQQRQTQRQSFEDRFRGLFSNIDFGGLDQIPDRIGNSVSRFGNAVGNLWNQIPERWDNFMQNMRPTQQDPKFSRLKSTTMNE